MVCAQALITGQPCLLHTGFLQAIHKFISNNSSMSTPSWALLTPLGLLESPKTLNKCRLVLLFMKFMIRLIFNLEDLKILNAYDPVVILIQYLRISKKQDINKA